MSRFKQGCIGLGLVLALATVGMMANQMYGRPSSTGQSQEQSASNAPSDTETTTGGGDATEYAGLTRAGVPIPALWSSQQALPVQVKDGEPSVEDGASLHAIGGGYGPVDTALVTLDALLDTTSGETEWRGKVTGLLSEDGAGVDHPISDAPRYWWAKRVFAPSSWCTVSFDAVFSNTTVSSFDHCSGSDGAQYTGALTDAIVSHGSYGEGETDFPVPDGLQVDSLTDPQLVVSRSYDSVSIPMDDGMWTVSVYCPATNPYVDADGNEIDIKGSASGDVFMFGHATGFGTKQHPCVSAEVAVAGQRPFWAVDRGGS
jgi:hypothetical protein